MSDSDLEQRLAELQLATPSKQLDDRILACVSPVKRNGQTNRHVALTHNVDHKSRLQIAIAASLLVGCTVGFLTGQTVRKSEANAVAEVSTTMKGAESPRMKSHVTKSTITTQFVGPKVSTACVLVAFVDSPQMPNTECQDCHSGLADSISGFRKSHLLLAEFATCSLCHASNVSLNSTAGETMF